MKAGDKVQYGDRQGELIQPISPSGFAQGQLWEIKFDSLPCSVYRWIKEEMCLVPKTTSEANP